MKWGKIRIYIRPSFVAYLIVLCLFSSLWTYISLTLALLFHEAAHLIACLVLKEPIVCIELSPFGGMMTYASGHSPAKGLKGIIVSLAGPLANYGILCLTPVFAFAGFHREFSHSLIQANLSLLLINLIPALPLDGGSMLLSIGYYVFPITALIRALSCLGIAAGCSLCILGLYGLLRLGTLNLTLPIIGIYLAIAAQKNHDLLITQNLYSVICDRLSVTKQMVRTRVYSISPNMPLLSLAKVISRSKSSLFACKYPDGQIYWVDDKAVCRAILSRPEGIAAELMDSPENDDQKE